MCGYALAALSTSVLHSRFVWIPVSSEEEKGGSLCSCLFLSLWAFLVAGDGEVVDELLCLLYDQVPKWGR